MRVFPNNIFFPVLVFLLAANVCMGQNNTCGVKAIIDPEVIQC